MTHDLENGHCHVCGGTPTAMPEECPDRLMTHAEQSLVAAGRLDYWDGTWHRVESEDT